MKLRIWDRDTNVFGFFPNEEGLVYIRDFRGMENVYDLSYILQNSKRYICDEYTGKQDILKNDIYGRDYIRIEHCFSEIKHVGIVTFAPDVGWGLHLEHEKAGYGHVWFPFYKMSEDEFKVCGNLHQNPEDIHSPSLFLRR